MTKAFVSYSRKDTDIARKLATAFNEKQMEIWIDWKNSPPTVDWKLQIQKGVEEADTFLFLISPDSIKSGECAEEIEHAVKNGKRLITLLVRKVDPATLPAAFRHINWIDFSKNESFDESFENLLVAINTDYEWLQTLRRLQVKALEWERNNKDHSFLLRGSDLDSAEGQLLVNASKEPEPTEIQREYVLESKKVKEAEQRAKEKQQRIITIASVVVAVVMLFLSVWAVNNAREANNQKAEAEKQRNEAKKQENIANANAKIADENAKKANDNATLAKIGEMSALAVGRIDQDYNEALLFSVEAYHQAEITGFNEESAKTALLATLQSRHGLVQILPGHTDWIQALVFSQDSTTIASSSWDDVTYLWDATDPRNPVKAAKIDGDDVAISADNRIAATHYYDEEFNSIVILWDVSDRTHPVKLSTFSGAYLVDFTPNSNYLITTGMDENGNDAIQIWDIANLIAPVQIRSLNGTNAYLSPAGSYLAVMDRDENFNTHLSLWDMANPRNPSKLVTLGGNYASDTPQLKQLAFGSDETFFAVSEYNDANNSVVKLWNITNPRNPQELSTISGTSDDISSLAISSDNTLLALGGSDGKIFVWNIRDPEFPKSSPSSDSFSGHTLQVSQIAFNPNGGLFTTGSYDGNILLWDLKLTNPVQITAPEGYPLASSLNGKMVASWYYYSETATASTLLWDVSEPYNPVQVGELPGDFQYADFSPNGKSIVTITYPLEEGILPSVALWDIANPAFPVEHNLLDITDLNNVSITYNPEGTILVVSDYNMNISTLWDISNIEKPEQFGMVEEPINGIVFSPRNDLFVLDISPSYQEGKTAFWDTSLPGQYRLIKTMDVSGVTFSPDGSLFAASTNDKDGNTIVQLWDTSNWRKNVPLYTLDGNVPAFSPDGKLLTTITSSEGEEKSEDVLLWDLTNPEKPASQRLTGHLKGIQSVAISPNNKLLASASADKTIIVWDISNLTEPVKLTTLTGHSDWVTYVAFSANSLTLASGGFDGSIILWDVQESKNIRQVGKLTGHTSSINSIQFPQDGKTLITSAGETIVWDIDPDSWVKKSCNIAGSNFTQDQWSRLSLGNYQATCNNIVELASDQTLQPVATVAGTNSSGYPLCTDTQGGLSACPLVTWNPIENERDRFCIDSVSYTLYALPEGTTLTPIDQGYTCTNEGVRGGYQMYTCYSLTHPNMAFRANMCNTGCQVSQSDQCTTGFGLDLSQSCCTPVSTDGCMEVTLEVGGCAQ